jgi:hypothetical protein
MRRDSIELIAEAGMKIWSATLAAAPLASAAAPAGAADCPAALDFCQRPLLGDQPVHLCEEFGGRVVLICKGSAGGFSRKLPV